MILEYSADAGNKKQPGRIFYFDKNVWLKYVGEMMPTLPEQFKLSVNEPGYLLKTYYSLLGINTRDEYGWICEYSTFGMAPGRRMAVIELLVEHRIDVLKKCAEYSNLQTKLYAVDALIYNDNMAKMKIQLLEKQLEKNQKQLSRLQNTNADKTKVDYLNSLIKNATDSITYFSADLLTSTEWKMIFDLRDSNQTVRTCGNAGSYKIYGTPISELLSDKAIADIPKRYEELKKLGYIR